MDKIKNNMYFILLMITYVSAASILDRQIRSEDADPVYLLVSTSSKIYCMKMPDMNRITNIAQQNYLKNMDDLKHYRVIYEEKSKLNTNWITDAFYVKSEDLIYVNVYNSTAASSDIFTLKYDSSKDVWIKNVLYKDQSYCLGIAYNEDKKELYWTAAKSIVSGSSITPKQPKVLFNLDSAKKLLYLKYDKLIDTIYVSTLNYVYSCPLVKSSVRVDDCQIIARDLQSARGLYLDSENRDLYVVDHKKRNLKKIKIKTPEQIRQEEQSLLESQSTSIIYNNLLASYQFDDLSSNNQNSNSNFELDSSNQIKTILSQDIVPDIGDIFYMCLYKNRYNINVMMWTEFSGKIKISSLNNTNEYRVLFSTNEYTYSINIMDNSTHVSRPVSSFNTNSVPTYYSTTIPTRFTTRYITTTITESTTIYYETETTSTLASTKIETTSTTSTTTSTTTTTTTTFTTSTTIAPTTTTEIPSTTNLIQTDTRSEEADYVNEAARRDDILFKPSSSLDTTTLPVETTVIDEEEEEDDDTTSVVATSSTIKLSTYTIVSSKTSRILGEFNQNKESVGYTEDLIYENDENSKLPTKPIMNKNVNKVQSFRAVSQNQQQNKSSYNNRMTTSLTSTSSPSSYNLLKSSPQLNVALYIVICLLCFSLVINIILLYISKMKQNQQNRENLIITHEICDKSGTMPSQRSSSNGGCSTKTSQSGDLAECNINLIQSNGSATSCIDSDQ